MRAGFSPGPCAVALVAFVAASCSGSDDPPTDFADEFSVLGALAEQPFLLHRGSGG